MKNQTNHLTQHARLSLVLFGLSLLMVFRPIEAAQAQGRTPEATPTAINNEHFGIQFIHTPLMGRDCGGQYRTGSESNGHEQVFEGTTFQERYQEAQAVGAGWSRWILR